MTEKVPFETNLKNLQQVVNELESGDVPLDKAMNKFRHGIELSNHLQGELSNAKTTLAKVVTDDGKEVPYERDKNGQDINNAVNGNNDNPFTD